MNRAVTRMAVSLVAVSSLLLPGVHSGAARQEHGRLAGRHYIQAQAMGEGTQLGRNFGVTVIVEQCSTPQDQQALIQAFRQRGNEGEPGRTRAAPESVETCRRDDPPLRVWEFTEFRGLESQGS